MNYFKNFVLMLEELAFDSSRLAIMHIRPGSNYEDHISGHQQLFCEKNLNASIFLVIDMLYTVRSENGCR